jgi:hypothetical protein
MRFWKMSQLQVDRSSLEWVEGRWFQMTEDRAGRRSVVGETREGNLEWSGNEIWGEARRPEVHACLCM